MQGQSGSAAEVGTEGATADGMVLCGVDWCCAVMCADRSKPHMHLHHVDGPWHLHARHHALTGLCPAAPFDVMLTCYTLFERDSAEQKLDRRCLSKFAWSHVVLDEAHALKNAASARTRALKRCDACFSHACSQSCMFQSCMFQSHLLTPFPRVCSVARHRVMLTGTPLQNDLTELHNLLSFLLPTVFGAEGQAALVTSKVGLLPANAIPRCMCRLIC